MNVTRVRLRLVPFFLFAFSVAGSAWAGTVSGVVRNATNGTPASNASVVLIALQGGMETVADTKTDAQGRYRLENASIGRQPMLIRVVYRGVNFHQPLPPGRDTVDVEVFDPTADPKSVQVTSRVIVFQPSGSVLIVGEEYTLRNDTKPPLAYFKADGNFEFALPPGAELNQVAAMGPSGMPTVQGTMDRGKNRYAIAYPIRPGENAVRISYQLPYASNKATLSLSSPYSAAQMTVVAPPSVQISGAGLQPAGNSQGMSLYARDAVPANATFDVAVSGTAPPPATAQSEQPDPANGRDTGPTVQTLPARLDSLKWILIGGFAALFIIGALLLWRRPSPAVAGMPSGVPAGFVPNPRNKNRKGEPVHAPASTPAADQAVAQVDREVTHSLDDLKDSLFRLELRHQAGTISEEDYVRERGRAEKILRDLVRG